MRQGTYGQAVCGRQAGMCSRVVCRLLMREISVAVIEGEVGGEVWQVAETGEAR